MYDFMAASVTFFVVSLMVTFIRAAARSTAEARDVVAGTAAENSGSRFRKTICEMDGFEKLKLMLWIKQAPVSCTAVYNDKWMCCSKEESLDRYTSRFLRH